MKPVYIPLFLGALVWMHCAGPKETLNPSEPVQEALQNTDAAAQSVQSTRTEAGAGKTKTVQPETPPENLAFGTIYFGYDQSDLSPEVRETLVAYAKTLQRYASIRLLIEGHCDERGTVEYNLALGERRATAVKRYLADLGVAEDRLYTVSYGKERPVRDGHSEQAWALNRRAEFQVVR